MRLLVILAAANVALGEPFLAGLLGNLNPLAGLIPGLGAQPDAPATDAPATDAPATDAPVLDAPAPQAPSLNAIANARNKWLADTVTVSRFLSIAESLTPSQMKAEATRALNAENDELIHKAVLDRQFLSASPDESVLQANNVLETQGTFQFVVDGLKRMSTSGASMTARQVSVNIQAMNQDRCIEVLPSIDMYFAAVGTLLNEGNVTQARRPTNCPPASTQKRRTLYH